jgi:hypothetical protein
VRIGTIVRVWSVLGAGRIGLAIRKPGRTASLVTLFAIVAMTLPAVASADTTQTIDFETMATGTQVSNQFDSLGIDFVNGVVNVDAGAGDNNVACYPVVKDAGSGAHSGTQVGSIACANGEFGDSDMYANLIDSTTNVSLWVNVPASLPLSSSSTVTLYAYTADDTLVGTDSATFDSADQTTWQHLSVSSGSPSDYSIASFSVYGPSLASGVAPGSVGAQVDDVNFVRPSSVPPPDFGVSASNGSGQPVQGGSATDTINIRRVNGSTGGISFSASGLPNGVTASFSPDPATGNSTTLTISASASAAATTFGSIPSFTITGSPASATAGTAPHSISEGVEVLPEFSLSYPNPVNVPACSDLQVPLKVQAPSGYTGSLSLSLGIGPSDDQASISPTVLSYPSETQATLTIKSQSDLNGASGTIPVTVTGNNGISTTWYVPVVRVAPSITRVSDSSGATTLTSGQVPEGADLIGTNVVIHGQGFCPGSTVYFGNAKASADVIGPVQDGIGTYGDETAILTNVPALATSGDIYVVPPGGTMTGIVGVTGTATAAFTIDSYRDTNSFSFDNDNSFQSAVGGYSWSDMKQVFGSQNTDIYINACWPWSDCSFDTDVPNPIAAIWWGIADASLRDGQCFGFSLSSQRLLDNVGSFNEYLGSFPLQSGVPGGSVWNLQGPAGNGGPGPALSHYIHLTHLEQLSSQALHFWLSKATGNAVNGSQTSLLSDVTQAIDAGQYPLVELQNGTSGHVVVAYAVDQTDGDPRVATGDRVIDVYDPNRPFSIGENALDGSSHQTTLQQSQIIVHPNGHWTFYGNFETPMTEWSGGPGSLVVMPANVVPVQPSLASNVGGLLDLVFGSADGTQVTDSAGHTLLTSDGSINASKSGIQGATQFATMTGSDKPGADIFMLGKAGNYTTTVHGTGAGQYHQVLFSNGDGAAITASATKSDTDSITALANLGGLHFGQSKGATSGGARSASVQLVGHSGADEITATVATTMPASGRAGVAFTGNDAGVRVTAGGQSTSAALTLAWTGPDGLPQTFVAPAVKLAAGDRADFTPSSWSALESGHLTVSIRHRNGRTTRLVLHNGARPADRYSVKLGVAKKGKRSKLQVTIHIRKLVTGSDALVTWEVLRGGKLAAKHVLTLSGKRLHRGTIHATFAFKPRSATYTFRGRVALLSPAKANGYVSQQIQRSKTFEG